MIRDLKDMFCNDHIYTKNYKIEALSFAWWAIRLGQVIAGMAVFYGFYVLMWLALA